MSDISLFSDPSKLSEIYARIKQEKIHAGRYTLEEAAKLISDATDVRYEKILQWLVEAVEADELVLYEPGRKLQTYDRRDSRFLDGTLKPIRTDHEEAFYYDLNKWLAEKRSEIFKAFQFPIPDSQAGPRDGLPFYVLSIQECKIILRGGTEKIPVADIPTLLARAVHFEPQKRVLRGLRVKGVERPLSDAERHALVECWSALPPLLRHLPEFDNATEFGNWQFEEITETEWPQYRDAAASVCKELGIELEPKWFDMEWDLTLTQAGAEIDYRKALETTVLDGQLIPRDASHLPLPGAVGETLKRAFIFVDDFIKYAEWFRVKVSVQGDDIYKPVEPLNSKRDLLIAKYGVAGADAYLAEEARKIALDNAGQRRRVRANAEAVLEQVDQSSPDVWRLKEPQRFPNYRKAVYDFLKNWPRSQLPPKAYKLLDSWKAEKPASIEEVSDEGIKYCNSRTFKAASAKDVQGVINCLVEYL